MKYAATLIACTAIICASTSIAAPSDTSSYLERRGQPISKAAQKLKDSEAAREAARRAAEFAKKAAKEMGTNAGQDYLDSQKHKDEKKDKRSFNDEELELALREYLERRGQPLSKAAQKLKESEAAREAARRAAEFAKKAAKEMGTNAGQDYLDSQKHKDEKKDKRSIDDEYFERRGQPISKAAQKLKDSEAAREAARRAAEFAKKAAKEMGTNAGQDYLDSQKHKDEKKDKRSIDEDYLERRGQPISKAAQKLKDSEAAREAARRAAEFAKKAAKEMGTNAGQDFLDSQKHKDEKKDKRSLYDDDLELALREYLERRGQPISKAAQKLKDSEAAREAARRAAEFAKKAAKEMGTNAGQDFLDSQKHKDEKKDKREYIFDLVDVVERELEAREYGIYSDLD